MIIIMNDTKKENERKRKAKRSSLLDEESKPCDIDLVVVIV